MPRTILYTPNILNPKRLRIPINDLIAMIATINATILPIINKLISDLMIPNS
jgi:hypothetical protein